MFDPNSKIKKIKGKDYLEVKWRIVWFREDHPAGAILTEIVSYDPVMVKATVHNNAGVILATGLGSPKTQGVSAKRPFEGAETAAIGRALAHAGYGTQFTGEDEGEHLANSPVEKQDTTPATWSPQHVKAVLDSTDQITAKKHAINWLNLVHPKTVPHITLLMSAYAEQRDAGLSPDEAAQAIQELNV
jgi:hypothetical protein